MSTTLNRITFADDLCGKTMTYESLGKDGLRAFSSDACIC